MSSSSLSSWHLMMAVLAVLMFAHLNVVALASLPLPSPASENVVALKSENVAMTPGQAVIAAVPAEERGAFVLYQLAQALNVTSSSTPTTNPRFNVDAVGQLNEMPQFKDVPVYDNFAEDLLHWTMQKFGFTETDLYKLLRTRTNMCTSNGVCYSQDAIGSFCCPF